MPARFKALRAALTASAHFLRPEFAKFLLARAEAALDTILPNLFFWSLSLVIPEAVFALLPLKTLALACLGICIESGRAQGLESVGPYTAQGVLRAFLQQGSLTFQDLQCFLETGDFSLKSCLPLPM